MTIKDWIDLALPIAVALLGALGGALSQQKNKNTQAYNFGILLDKFADSAVQFYAATNMSNKEKARAADQLIATSLHDQGYTNINADTLAAARDKAVNKMNISNGKTDTEFSQSGDQVPVSDEAESVKVSASTTEN